MPAGITGTDGMMYVGETPWHRQGVKLDNPATAAEALDAASLDWEVVKEPVYVRDWSGAFIQVPDKMAIVRADTRKVFAVMSNGYEPVQQRNAFNMFDGVVGLGEAIYHTAGSLYGGKKIWILAKLPDDILIAPGDVVQPFILLSNSHDGSQALRMQITPIRVVCANTLSFAQGASGGFYGKHTRNILTRTAQAREVLGLAQAYYAMFARQVDRLVETRMTVLDTEDYLQKLYNFKDDVHYNKQDHRRVKALESTMDLLNHPTNTVGGMAGTAWAAYNAVTYYIDHERGGENGTDTQRSDRRLHSSWFGVGANIRQRAYDLLLDKIPSS